MPTTDSITPLLSQRLLKIDVHIILAKPPKGARFFAFLEFVKSNEDNCMYYKKN